MEIIDNCIISNKYDRQGGQVLKDTHYRGCTFDRCSVSLVFHPDDASAMRRVKLTDCAAIHCDIGPSIIEDVEVDGLSIQDLLILWSPRLRRVVLQGEIGEVKINSSAHYLDKSPQLQELFDHARADYYAGVDWALDIREAKFVGFDVSGVPTHLIRRDPATQVVVTRAKATSIDWRSKISPSNTHWAFVLDEFLEEGEDSIVLVAPRGRPKKMFEARLAGLLELREIGVAEPD